MAAGAAAIGGGFSELPSALLVVCAVTAIGVGGGLVQSVLSPFPVAISTPSFGRARRPRGRGKPGLGVLVFVLELGAGGAVAGLVAVSRFALGVRTLPGAVVAAGLGGLVWRRPPAWAGRRLAGACPRCWPPCRRAADPGSAGLGGGVGRQRLGHHLVGV